LDNRCSNNQAEQLAIVKALEALESLNIEGRSQRTAAVITDSRVALNSIKNIHNHSFLIEDIRLMLSKLERPNWTIVFSWVKAHVGITGDELADKIAKAAVRDNENTITYNRIPKSTIYKELEYETLIKWQKAWEESPKAALTKQFFPSISDRINEKIKVTPNFTAIVSVHGKTRAYLHRFKYAGKCNMSLRQGRANHGPSDTPLHSPTATKGNTKEGNNKTRNLAYKQTRINN
jgi:ribonuclease HI